MIVDFGLSASHNSSGRPELNGQDYMVRTSILPKRHEDLHRVSVSTSRSAQCGDTRGVSDRRTSPAPSPAMSKPEITANSFKRLRPETGNCVTHVLHARPSDHVTAFPSSRCGRHDTTWCFETVTPRTRQYLELSGVRVCLFPSAVA